MSKIIRGSGDPQSKIWFIGEAPGQTEIVEGKPFVGNAGMTLRRFCMQIGIDPSECFFDNIWNQRAPKDKLQLLFKNGTPTMELAKNIEDLNKRIKKHKPNVIIALGAIPTHVLTGHLSWSNEYHTFTPLQDCRGTILEHQSIPGQKIIPTFHPSYINREGYSDHGIFLADLTRGLRESAFPEIRRPEKELILDPLGPKLHEVRDRLIEESEIITVDIEYIGKKLLCIGFTNSRDWATSIGIHSETELEICRQIIMSGKPLNMQNAAFDYSILEWHYNIPAIEHIAYDTMLAAHAINPELPKDLGFLHSIYSECPYPYKGMVDWDLIKKGQQPLSVVYEYNAIDAWGQHEIMEEQLSEDFASDPDAFKVFKFEMALLRPLWEISKRGMLIDPERKVEYATRLVQELEIERATLRVLNGGKPINVKSGDDVADMLFAYLGLRPGGKSKKSGKYKTDDKTLASLLGRAETKEQKYAITLIRSARGKRDLLSKFVNVELDEDGRTRGIYNPGGTVTGRLSSKKFFPTSKGHQQQNIPVKGRHIIVPDKGFLFGQVDGERAESHVVAHLTNDPLMLEHHAPGADAHTLLACLFFECDASEIDYERRFIMKKTRHAGNYMEGPITFMRDVNKTSHLTGVSITTKQATEFIEWYRKINTGLKPWWLKIREQLYNEHKLTTLLGRTRTFFDRVDSCLPEAVAFVPQGTIGDWVNFGLLNLSGIITEQAKERLDWWEEIPEIGAELRKLNFQLLNQVHDSIGFQFPPKNETRVQELVTRALSIPLRNPHTHEDFYIGLEFKAGKSWGEAS